MPSRMWYYGLDLASPRRRYLEAWVISKRARDWLGAPLAYASGAILVRVTEKHSSLLLLDRDPRGTVIPEPLLTIAIHISILTSSRQYRLDLMRCY